ncbi:MAG: FliG C-terminal domain-containing protein [Phycisphaerae bacterium]
MPRTGRQKAAMLLMTLDPDSATELMGTISSDAMAAVGAEISCLYSAGIGREQAAEELQEELEMFLQGQMNDQVAFVRQMIEGALGSEQSREVLNKVNFLVRSRDPFHEIREARIDDLAEVLNGESAEVAALVISELPSAKSIQLMPMIEPEIRQKVVHFLATCSGAPINTKVRIARAVQARLKSIESLRGDAEELVEGGRKRQQYRKVAMLLRGLEQGPRQDLLKSIREQDEEAAEAIKKLMVAWEDVQKVEDRTMQEILRGVEPNTLAVALYDADEPTIEKIRRNISERVENALDEEMSLLSKPPKKELEKARSQIVDIMFDLNSQNMLIFEDE